MREAHLGPVDCAVARRLEQRQHIVVSWVPDNLLQRILLASESVLHPCRIRSVLAAHLDPLDGQRQRRHGGGLGNATVRNRAAKSKGGREGKTGGSCSRSSVVAIDSIPSAAE